MHDIAPVRIVRVGTAAHPLTASSKDIQKMFNGRWTEAWHSWREIIRMAPCSYCGRLPANRNTVDHILPRKFKAGGYHWDNFGTACPKCNGRRGHETIVWFLWWMRGKDLGASVKLRTDMGCLNRTKSS